MLRFILSLRITRNSNWNFSQLYINDTLVCENTWGDNVLRQSTHRQENEQDFRVYVNRLHPQKGLTKKTANSTILTAQN